MARWHPPSPAHYGACLGACRIAWEEEEAHYQTFVCYIVLSTVILILLVLCNLNNKIENECYENLSLRKVL